MRNFYTLTEEEFETAARFLQVTSLMRVRTNTRYDNETSLVSYETHGVGCVERRKQLREWLDSQIPRCTSWTANTYRGTTVQWDGASLTLHRCGKVLAEFLPSQLQEEPRFHGNWQHVPGASIKDDGTFEGRYDLRKLVVVGTLGRVLYLLGDAHSTDDITRARRIVSLVLQEAGIYVVSNATDGTFEDSLIVWGFYGAPIEAIERAKKKPEKRFMGEPKQKEKRPLSLERRAKLYTWITAGIVALILLTAGVVSGNESNPGIFLWAICLVAIVAVATLAILDT